MMVVLWMLDGRDRREDRELKEIDSKDCVLLRS
jgi:hypothetical protein